MRVATVIAMIYSIKVLASGAHDGLGGGVTARHIPFSRHCGGLL